MHFMFNLSRYEIILVHSWPDLTPYQTSTTTRSMIITRTLLQNPWNDFNVFVHYAHITTGLKFNGSQTDAAFKRVWDVLKQSRSPVFHAIGNHELYNFKSEGLREQFNDYDGTQVEGTPHSRHMCRNTILFSRWCDSKRKITALVADPACWH